MATESSTDSELSVTLPPSLSEWLDQRATALDIEREALLVQLLETHRSTAEIDDDGLASLFESVAATEPASGSAIDDLEAHVAEVDDRTDDVGERLDHVDSRVDDLEAKVTNNVEDVRKRVLQLRDAVEDRTPADHSHEELESLADRLETVSANVEDLSGETDELAEELWWLSTEMGSTDERVETLESKIDRLARAVLNQKRRRTAGEAAATGLDEIRRAANRSRTPEADCGGCGTPVRIGLLSEAVCPHCDRRLYGLETPNSVFRWFKNPTLTVEETPTSDETAEDADE